MKRFGKLLRQTRGDISASELARRIGVSPQYWSDVERGRRGPFDKDMTERVATLLSVDAEPLLVAREHDMGGWWIDQKRIPDHAHGMVASMSRGRLWSAGLWEAVVKAWNKLERDRP